MLMLDQEKKIIGLEIRIVRVCESDSRRCIYRIEKAQGNSAPTESIYNRIQNEVLREHAAIGAQRRGFKSDIFNHVNIKVGHFQQNKIQLT